MRVVGPLVAVLVLLLAGCRSGAGAGEAERPAGVDRAAGRLLVGLGVDGGDATRPLVLRAGEPVRFALVLENRGRQPARLLFGSGQSYDLVIARDDREVWRWSADQVFTQAQREETLAAGARRVDRVVWPGTDAEGRPVPPGEYTARGIVTLSSPLETPPLRFTLEAP